MSIGLHGPLGIGKTTLTRYLVEALGGDPTHVSSPTFTLQHEYATTRGFVIEHWDLYRVSVLPPELEIPPSVSCIRLIEWWDKCGELARDLSMLVELTLESDGTRVAEIHTGHFSRVGGA